MTQRPIYLTEEGIRKYREELEFLRTVRRREVAEALRRAAEVGGTVDNAEYEAAKREQAQVEGRILELENLLKTATVIAPGQGGGVVRLGSIVVVEDQKGRRFTYQIVGSAEAEPAKGKISNESPIGQALLGLRPGDTANVRTPGGVVRLQVLEVR
jgi:transcription elongation factor GreA